MLRALKYQDVVAELYVLWKQNAVAQEHHRFTSSPSQTDPPAASFLTPIDHRKEASHEERHSNNHSSNRPKILPLAPNSHVPRMWR
jgi:hypothetical protein